MRDLGEQGWELVAVIDSRSHGVWHYFKRQLTPQVGHVSSTP